MYINENMYEVNYNQNTVNICNKPAILNGKIKWTIMKTHHNSTFLI